MGGAELRQEIESILRAAPPLMKVLRTVRDDRLTIFAPFGLKDPFAMRLRPNPLRATAAYAKTVASVTKRWPEVQVTFP